MKLKKLLKFIYEENFVVVCCSEHFELSVSELVLKYQYPNLLKKKVSKVYIVNNTLYVEVF